MDQNRTDLAWRKSSYSGPDGNCVEMAFVTGADVAVRDTKNHGTGPVLTFTAGDWAAFLSGLKS